MVDFGFGPKHSRSFCFYCECHLDYENRTEDHIIPLSKGGLRKHKVNRVYCCDQCNSLKSNMLPREFAEFMKAGKCKKSVPANSQKRILANAKALAAWVDKHAQLLMEY